jgi:hypothetical protein
VVAGKASAQLIDARRLRLDGNDAGAERDECFIIVSDVSAYIEAEVARRDQCAIKIPQSPALAPAPAIEVIEKKPSRADKGQRK